MVLWARWIRDIRLYYMSPHYWEGLESVPKANCNESCTVFKTLFIEVGKLPRTPLLRGSTP